MTRVNVGIEPRELCDQHLLAELHELPRCFAFGDDRGPASFCLGPGHVLWCARHRLSLVDRMADLREEAAARGFKLSDWPPPRPMNSCRWSDADAARASVLLRERIRARLSTMVGRPRWTARSAPAWVSDLAVVTP